MSGGGTLPAWWKSVLFVVTFDTYCTISKEMFGNKNLVIVYEAGVTYSLKIPVTYEVPTSRV